MTQVWLQTNRRILWLIAVAPLLLLACGVVAAIDPWRVGALFRLLGVAVGAIAVAALALLWLMGRQPRVAYRDGRVLFYIRRFSPPAAIPLDAVDCFLLGQGPALLPGDRHAKTQTRTVVVRLAERAVEWSRGQADPRLAAWCDGYITLRGTWCEPLDLAVVSRLNRVLHEASRADV